MRIGDFFKWGRKNEGFSWEKHIRTTILVRRAKRREKIDDIKDAASDGLKKAGEAGQAAGRRGVQVAHVGKQRAAEHANDLVDKVVTHGPNLMRRALDTCAHLAHQLGITLWSVSGKIFATLSKLASQATQYKPNLPKPDINFLIHSEPVQKLALHLSPQLFFPALAIGVLALAVSVLHFVGSGFGSDVLIAGLVAIVFLGVAFIIGLKREEGGRRRSPQIILHATDNWRRYAGYAGVLTCIGFVAWGLFTSISYAVTNVSSLVSLNQAETYRGRATALTGDKLRIGRRVVQLDGIDAPHRYQLCRTQTQKTWRCGRDARNALRRLVRRKTVTCQQTGTSDRGTPTVKCKTKTVSDIARHMVSKGHAFAEAGFFSTYRSAEKLAREKGSGVWRGTAQRPDDYKSEKWKVAQGKSPTGCPIKGRVLRTGRKYLLPWDPGYDKARLRDRRGERWFCSESEAQAAGWKPGAI